MILLHLYMPNVIELAICGNPASRCLPNNACLSMRSQKSDKSHVGYRRKDKALPGGGGGSHSIFGGILSRKPLLGV